MMLNINSIAPISCVIAWRIITIYLLLWNLWSLNLQLTREVMPLNATNTKTAFIALTMNVIKFDIVETTYKKKINNWRKSVLSKNIEVIWSIYKFMKISENTLDYLIWDLRTEKYRRCHIQSIRGCESSSKDTTHNFVSFFIDLWHGALALLRDHC